VASVTSAQGLVSSEQQCSLVKFLAIFVSHYMALSAAQLHAIVDEWYIFAVS